MTHRPPRARLSLTLPIALAVCGPWAAAQALPDGAVTLNEDFQIDWCNRMARQHLGLVHHRQAANLARGHQVQRDLQVVVGAHDQGVAAEEFDHPRGRRGAAVEFVEQCPIGAYGVCRNARVGGTPYQQDVHYYGVASDATYLKAYCEQQSKGVWMAR